MICEEQNFGRFTCAVRKRLSGRSEIPLVTKTEGSREETPRGRGRIVADGRM